MNLQCSADAYGHAAFVFGIPLACLVLGFVIVKIYRHRSNLADVRSMAARGNGGSVAVIS